VNFTGNLVKIECIATPWAWINNLNA
jgi:hypothetical protein